MRDTVRRLREKGVEFDEGLSNAELDQIQKRYELKFPADLIEFLSVGLPISKNFPNWRAGTTARAEGPKPIEEILERPAKGILFDVQHNEFWLPSWGNRPASTDDALDEASRHIALAPKLIPLWGHRYLPSEPAESGNPVLSVMQTDIVYYGVDLIAYFAREFRIESLTAANGKRAQRRIRFWSDIIEFEDDRFLQGDG